MGFADNRQIKTFTEMITRIFTPAEPGSQQGSWSMEEDEPIDQQVNSWVRETNSIIIQVNPTWMQIPDEYTQDGKMIRRAITRYVVVYTTEGDFFEMEAKTRRMALLGEGVNRPEPTAQPMTAEDELAETIEAPPKEELTIPKGTGEARVVKIDDPVPAVPQVQQPAIDSDAGGPPGFDSMQQVPQDGFYTGARNAAQ